MKLEQLLEIMREKHWAIAVRQRRTQLTVQVWASYEDPVDQTHDWKKVYRHRFTQETMDEFFLRVAEDCGWSYGNEADGIINEILQAKEEENLTCEFICDKCHKSSKWNAMEEELNNNEE